MKIHELFELVKRLNDLALDRTEHLSRSIAPWELRTNGDSYQIRFTKYPIWDSDDDEREELENGEYEPLEEFLCREVSSVLEMLSCTLRPTDEQIAAQLKRLNLRCKDGNPAKFAVANGMVIIEGGQLDSESIDVIARVSKLLHSIGAPSKP